MQAQQAEAKKRCLLKRYLVTFGVNHFESNWPTPILRALVVGLHAARMKRHRLNYAWPVTGEKILEIAKENHYLNQLICCKHIWGHQATTGCVLEDNKTVQCRTVADMIRIGWVPKRYAYLDSLMHTLPVMKFNNSN